MYREERLEIAVCKQENVLKSLGIECDQSWTEPVFDTMAQSTSSVCSCTVWIFLPKSLTAACSDVRAREGNRDVLWHKCSCGWEQSMALAPSQGGLDLSCFSSEKPLKEDLFLALLLNLGSAVQDKMSQNI